MIERAKERGMVRRHGGNTAFIQPGSEIAEYVEVMLKAWVNGELSLSWPTLAENINTEFGLNWGKDPAYAFAKKHLPELYAAVRRG